MIDKSTSKLGNISTIISRGMSPKYVDESTIGYLVINQKCIRDQIVNFEFARYYDRNQKVKPAALIAPGDILINSTGIGTLGRTAIVKNVTTNLAIDSHVSIVRLKKNIANPSFVGYHIELLENVIENFASGSTGQTELSRKDIANLDLYLPPLPEQQRIVSILSTYDDLIENNTKRINILEQMAEQIYKEWFVRMRFPGYENAAFEKGMPKVWAQVYFRDFIKLNRGFDLPDDKIVDGDFPVITFTSIKAFHNKYKVEAPCITTGRSGSLGSVQYVNMKSWPLNTSLYVKDYKGNSPRFVYYFLKSLKLENFNSGSGVPTLNQNHLHTLKFHLPNQIIQNKFDDIIIPIFNQVENIKKQIEVLKQTRDLLLPRLISGKLRVKDISEPQKLSV